MACPYGAPSLAVAHREADRFRPERGRVVTYVGVVRGDEG
jgi:hypothetical protein